MHSYIYIVHNLCILAIPFLTLMTFPSYKLYIDYLQSCQVFLILNYLLLQIAAQQQNMIKKIALYCNIAQIIFLYCNDRDSENKRIFYSKVYFLFPEKETVIYKIILTQNMPIILMYKKISNLRIQQLISFVIFISGRYYCNESYYLNYFELEH